MKNLQDVVNFSKALHDSYGKFRQGFVLSPQDLESATALPTLDWKSIMFTDMDSAKKEISNEERGIYAFVIASSCKFLPSHGYVMYIGIAGRDSDRSLFARFSDYHNSKKVLKRPRIARLIADWHLVLQFHFAHIDQNMTSDELESIEKKLNSALHPPCSAGDFEATIKQKRIAFN